MPYGIEYTKYCEENTAIDLGLHKTRYDQKRNHQKNSWVVPIVEKMIESHFRWFGHALKRPKELIKRIDEVEGSLI